MLAKQHKTALFLLAIVLILLVICVRISFDLHRRLTIESHTGNRDMLLEEKSLVYDAIMSGTNTYRQLLAILPATKYVAPEVVRQLRLYEEESLPADLLVAYRGCSGKWDVKGEIALALADMDCHAVVPLLIADIERMLDADTANARAAVKPHVLALIELKDSKSKQILLLIVREGRYPHLDEKIENALSQM